jgi:hypothetical protein
MLKKSFYRRNLFFPTGLIALSCVLLLMSVFMQFSLQDNYVIDFSTISRIPIYADGFQGRENIKMPMEYFSQQLSSSHQHEIVKFIASGIDTSKFYTFPIPHNANFQDIVSFNSVCLYLNLNCKYLPKEDAFIVWYGQEYIDKPVLLCSGALSSDCSDSPKASPGMSVTKIPKIELALLILIWLCMCVSNALKIYRIIEREKNILPSGKRGWLGYRFSTRI